MYPSVPSEDYMLLDTCFRCYCRWKLFTIGGVHFLECSFLSIAAYGNLRAPPLPLKETLSLVLNVEFKTGDEEWSMCCKRFSVE